VSFGLRKGKREERKGSTNCIKVKEGKEAALRKGFPMTISLTMLCETEGLGLLLSHGDKT
jgi:hypothetical protein